MKITLISGGDRYRYLWLKRIRGVNLGEHCAGTFAGSYHPGIDPKNPDCTVEIEPDPAVLAYYLCGVVTPWNWQRNAHLAFVPAPGETHSELATAGDPNLISGSTLRVELEDAAPVWGWGEQSIAPEHPKAHVKGYRICRNWQFAHHLASVRGLPV